MSLPSIQTNRIYWPPSPAPLQRRLSMSSSSQWTAQGRAASAHGVSSGYALSPSSSSSEQATPFASSPSSPSSSNTRHLDPVSIFERLGLGGVAAASPTASGQTHTSLTSAAGQQQQQQQQGNMNYNDNESEMALDMQQGPSPYGEDAALPTDAFEGIQSPPSSHGHALSRAAVSGLVLDNKALGNANSNSTSFSQGLGMDLDIDLVTPIQEHRRTLSNDTVTADHDDSHARPSFSSLTSASASASAESNISPRTTGETLLEAASVPPVDIVNPSSGNHPHHIRVSYGNDDKNEAGNNKIIPVGADILLPFVERPVEVRELLYQERNRGLVERLQEIFTPHSTVSSSSSSSASSTPPLSTSTSSSRSSNTDKKKPTTWSEVESILYQPRSNLSDQEWIDSLKKIIFPRSTALWERLRACLGIDVDDERGSDKYEELSSDFMMPPAFITAAGGGSASTGGMHQFGSGNSAPFNMATTPNMYPTSSPSLLSTSQAAIPPALADDFLSPRAVMKTQLAPLQQQVAGTSTTAPMSIPGARMPHSPSSPAILLSATGTSPSPSPGPGSSGARAFDRTAGTTSNNSSANNSPIKDSSSRMHRRTSSGGSSFRRSFAMSSISEDAPVHTFHDAPKTPVSGTTPPSPLPIMSQGQDTSGSASAGSNWNAPDGYLGITPSSASSASSMPAYSPGGSSFMPSPAPVGHSSVQGSALGSSRPISSSFGSSGSLNMDSGPATGISAVGGAITASPNLSRSGSFSNVSRSASFSGLANSWKNAGSFGGHSPTPQMVNPRHYDDYASVFESDDGSSVGGGGFGNRSTGRGPGMRASFGSFNAPASRNLNKPSSGFALAGLNLNKSTSRT